MSVSLKIKIFGKSGTRILQVAKSTLTIGSASHCDVVIDEPTVNAEHTRAWIEAGRIWIQDLGSPGGTALNDIRLPALKPMLVRDLDVLRLGESKSTIGLEAIAVRAPVVKPQPVESGVKAPSEAAPKAVSSAELQKRRDEAEALAREVADLRLQLQMANLDKTAAEEMNHQLNSLKAEVERVQEQKKKWDEGLRKLEAEKANLRKEIDKELAEFKTNSLKQLKSAAGSEAAAQIQNLSNEVAKLREQADKLSASLRQAEAEKQSLRGEMKKESDHGHEVDGEIKKLNEKNVKLAEMLKQAETEREVLKKTIERERAEAKATIHALETAAANTGRQAAKMLGAADKSAENEAKEARRTKRRREARRSAKLWRQIGVASLVLAFVLAGVWMTAAYLRNRGARSLSSTAPAPPPAEHPVDPPKTSFVKRRFDPKQGRKYRNSYTENVLYLENYVAAEENADFRRRWMGELSKVATTDWKVDSWSLSPVGVEEQALIHDLERMKLAINPDREAEGIQAMHEREGKFLKDLEGVFKTRSGVDRFLRFKRGFYQRNQAYLSRVD